MLDCTLPVQYDFLSCLFDDRFSREDQASRRTRRTTEFCFIPASSRFELDPLGYQVFKFIRLLMLKLFAMLIIPKYKSFCSRWSFSPLL